MEPAIPEIFDDLEIGITLHDPETGEILGVNERLEELYGYSSEQLQGMDVAEYSADEGGFTQAEAKRRIRAASEGAPQTFEWRVKRANDELVWVRVRLAETTIDGDDVVVAEIRDITERKQRERDLRDERAFSESVIEGVPDVFYAFDEYGQFYEWNDRLNRVTGYTDEEIAEMSPREFFPEDERDRIDETIATIIETKAPQRVESQYLTRDGECIPFEFSGGPLLDADGNLDGIVGIGRDITERKRREQELREQREMFDQLSENVDDVIWITSPGKDEMEFVSPAYEVVWGRSVDSLYENPESFVAAIHDDDRERVLEALDRQQEDPESYDETYRVVHPDGEIRWVNDRAFGVRDGGDLERIVGIATDITEQKEHEAALERSNERLQEFAYILSHDLQEPLRMVSSYIDLLETELGDDLDEETQEYMDFATDGADRMRSMIDGVLQYSRVETQGSEFEPTDVTEVLDGVLHDLEFKLEDADAEVTVGDLPTVQADPQQLGQLFQNLIKNAVDHGSPDSGRLDVDITGSEVPAGHRFAVADNGPGIPADERDELFRLFSKRADSEGTGIGLAVCQRIVERHGGSIWIESTPGEGTTVYFTISETSNTPTRRAG